MDGKPGVGKQERSLLDETVGETREKKTDEAA